MGRFIGLADTNKNEKFVNAASVNSVRTSKFLEGLDIDPIMLEFNKHYSVKEDEETYPRRAMFKTMIWRKTKNIKYYTRTENHLNDFLNIRKGLNDFLNSPDKGLIFSERCVLYFQEINESLIKDFTYFKL